MQDNLRFNEDPVPDEIGCEGSRNESATSQTGATNPIRKRSPGKIRAITIRVLWAGHWLLRIWLAGYLLIYGWSKVFLMGDEPHGFALAVHGLLPDRPDAGRR